jgi:hypothetical protein
MGKRRNWNPTTLLWASNAAVWPLLALAIGYRFGLLDAGGGLPEMRSLTPVPMQLSAQVSESVARNPFDPEGGHWGTAVATAPASGGELRGVMLMPGVSVALTGTGVVRLGEQLAGGRVKEIRANKVIVRRDSETVELDLASANRPTLQSLNRRRQSHEASPEEAGQ